MPDALFCGNDQIARGAVDALREMGLGVPDDVAVVGFDNWDVMVEAARPPLTSVDMNLEALGREAGASLMEMMAGRALKGVRRLPCSLVIRDSCGARHAAHREGKAIMSERAYSAIPFADVRITGPFWRERLETVLKRTIPSQHAKLKEVGILNSLKLPKPVPPLTIPRNSHNFTMQVFWDSDVGKWIEAASYALAHRRDADIEAKIDAIVDDLARAQSPDGYLNCWYNGREPEKRWTNLRDNHELYNAGHLLEGAIAYFRATGRRRMLDIMERYVDHIAATFGRGPGQKRGYPGHQEIELALVKLYRLTGDRRRLDLASYFIDERGSQPHYFTEEALARGDDPASYWAGTYEYNQSHIPVREQTRVVGHAVRAMYMASAMADLASELNDSGLKRACEALWRDVTTAQMYVTAGLGPKETNEGFTEPYDLPERNGLCRDLRLGRAHLLGPSHAPSRSRRALCRRDGACALQWRADRPRPRRDALLLFQSARKPRPAQTMGLAPLSLLHDERVAPGRVGGRLRDIGARGRRRLPPLRRVRNHGDIGRRASRLA